MYSSVFLVFRNCFPPCSRAVFSSSSASSLLLLCCFQLAGVVFGCNSLPIALLVLAYQYIYIYIYICHFKKKIMCILCTTSSVSDDRNRITWLEYEKNVNCYYYYLLEIPKCFIEVHYIHKSAINFTNSTQTKRTQFLL